MVKAFPVEAEPSREERSPAWSRLKMEVPRTSLGWWKREVCVVGGCGKALGAGQGVRAAKTLPCPEFSSWGFEKKLGCCWEGSALSLLWLGGAGCFPKLSSARATPIPPQGLS